MSRYSSESMVVPTGERMSWTMTRTRLSFSFCRLPQLLALVARLGQHAPGDFGLGGLARQLATGAASSSTATAVSMGNAVRSACCMSDSSHSVARQGHHDQTAVRKARPPTAMAARTRLRLRPAMV